MLSDIEPARRISREEYDAQEHELRWQLLEAQFSLKDHNRPLLLVIAGMDGAGKGALTQKLNEWLDPRDIQTSTFWLPSDEEQDRPYYWRFWRRMPRRGNIGIFLGSWYTDILHTAMEEYGEARITKAVGRINFFEEMLIADDMTIVKIWLHLDQKQQKKQLQERAGKQQNLRVTDRPYEIYGRYDEQIRIAEPLIRMTSTESAPWKVLDAGRRRYRELETGGILLKAMLDVSQQKQSLARPAPFTATKEATRLNSVNLKQALDRTAYKKQLRKLQPRLQDLAWQAYRDSRPVIAAFEGWDAAGKGSAIRRVTNAIDPRLYRLVRIAAPTDEELAHHYLWRFWRHIERDGRGTFFDRSWYGRVLVERVEGFAKDAEWQRGFDEINEFEKQLHDHGAIVLKFWLHISPEEQLHRFRAREQERHKQHKITDDDWRNREKWSDYVQAVEDMLERTDTDHAPWHLVAANDKPWARIFILRTFCEALERALYDAG